MKYIGKIFNILSTLFSILAIMLLYIFYEVVSGGYFNGYTVLIVLCMFLNPIRNIFRVYKRYINNPIYHILVTMLCTYIIYISFNSLCIYKMYYNDDSDLINKAINYFGERFILIFILTLLLLIISLLFKKKVKVSERNNAPVMLIIIIITSLMTVKWGMSLIGLSFSLVTFIFSIIVLFKIKGTIGIGNVQLMYMLLFLLCLLSANSIGVVLSVYMFIQANIFELNI